MKPLIDLLVPHVNKDGGIPSGRPELGPCWIWGLNTDRDGYGSYSHKLGGTRFVHRLMYEHYKGAVPNGLVLDHLCRVPACCNPEHLEPVTNRENTLRGESFVAKNATKEKCHLGHPFDEANTYFRGGKRHCRACNRSRARSYWRRKSQGAS